MTLPETSEAQEEADVWEDNEENRKRRWTAWKAAKAAKAARQIEEKLSLVSSISLSRCSRDLCPVAQIFMSLSDFCIRFTFRWSRMKCLSLLSPIGRGNTTSYHGCL